MKRPPSWFFHKLSFSLACNCLNNKCRLATSLSTGQVILILQMKLKNQRQQIGITWVLTCAIMCLVRCVDLHFVDLSRVFIHYFKKKNLKTENIDFLYTVGQVRMHQCHFLTDAAESSTLGTDWYRDLSYSLLLPERIDLWGLWTKTDIFYRKCIKA